MIESACSQQVSYEIEPLLNEGKYEEARVLLSCSLEQDPSDRESRLYLLLVNVMLNGPIAYENDIDKLRDLVDLSNTEKEIVRRIFVLGFEAADKDGREEQAWVYQRLLRRLLLAQALDQPIHKDTASISSANENETQEITHETLIPFTGSSSVRLKDKIIGLGRHIASSLEEMWLSGRAGLRRQRPNAWQPKVSPKGALAVAAVALLFIPIVYFGSPRGDAAKDTPPNYTTPTLSLSLPRAKLTSSVISREPVPLSENRDDSKSINKKQVNAIVAGQLSELRRAYADWSQKDRNLMGSLLLKMRVDANGNVITAEEQTSRLTDAAFSEVILNEARKWKFPKSNGDTAEFIVPLVFVPRGMDPRTIVRWEKAFTSSDVGTKAVSPLHITGPSAGESERELSGNPDQRRADLRNPKIALASAGKTHTAEETPKNAIEYKTQRAVSLREKPRFAAATAEDIDPGTGISVLEAKGDWVKVKTRPSGKVGYVRKEYIVPASAIQ
jgi:hypothetical protein